LKIVDTTHVQVLKLKKPIINSEAKYFSQGRKEYGKVYEEKEVKIF
jgi:hypothetical protein